MGQGRGNRLHRGPVGRPWLCLPGAEDWGNHSSSAPPSTSGEVLAKTWHNGSHRSSRQSLTTAAFRRSAEKPARKRERVIKQP